MSKKPIAILAGILAFISAGYLTRHATDWLRREPAVSSQLLEKAWRPHDLGGGVRLDSPVPLTPQPVKFPPEVASLITSTTVLGGEGDGVIVQAMRLSYRPGTPTSLDGAADGALSNMRTVPGTSGIQANKSEGTILGERAIELQATISRERGLPLQLLGTVWQSGPDLFQVLLIARADQPRATEAWRKLRSSIRGTA